MAEHVEYREPAKWPTVVGVVSIVWGGFGLICGVCSGVMTMVPSLILDRMPEGPERTQVERNMAANALWPIEYPLMGIGVLMAIFLIIAGIMLIKRNAGARPMHLVYGIVGVVMVAVHAVVGTMKVPQAVEASVPPGSSPEVIQQAKVGGFVMLGCLLLFFLLWPAFCVIWFGLVKRDSQDLVPVESHGI